MKITRRTVLRLTGAAAASLALSSCSASGSAILGSNFSSWLQQTLGIRSSGAASSAASSEAMAASSPAAGEQPAFCRSEPGKGKQAALHVFLAFISFALCAF